MNNKKNTEKIKFIVLNKHLNTSTKIRSFDDTDNQTKRLLFRMVEVDLNDRNVLFICPDVYQCLFLLEDHRKSLCCLSGNRIQT